MSENGAWICPRCGCQWTDTGKVQPTIYEFAVPQHFGKAIPTMPTMPPSPTLQAGTQTATEYHRWEMCDIGTALGLAGATGVLVSGAVVSTILGIKAEDWLNWIVWPFAGALDVAVVVFIAKMGAFLRDDLAIVKTARSERPIPPMPAMPPAPVVQEYHVKGEFDVPMESTPEAQSTQFGEPIIARGPKRNAQRTHKVYLDFAVGNPRAWHLFCKAAHNKVCNFSGRAAAGFGIDNTKGSEWDAIVGQFADRHLLKRKGKSRTKPTLNASGAYVVGVFADTPPLLG